MDAENLVFRRVERKNGENWDVITFDQLRKGDLFKLYDPVGEPQWENGDQIYIAKGDAFPCEPGGNYGIEADEYEQA